MDFETPHGRAASRVVRVAGTPWGSGLERGRPSRFPCALARAKIDAAEVTVHTLRHTALSRMIAAGYDDYTVMEISGHSSTRMLARYMHPTADRKIAALEDGFVVTQWSQWPDLGHAPGSHRHGKAPVSVIKKRVRDGGPHGTRTRTAYFSNW